MEVNHPPERFEFTPEQLALLQSQDGQPLHVPDQTTQKVYLVVEEGVIPTLDEAYIRQGLAHAAEQAAQGGEQVWSAEEIKAAGRKLLTQRNQQA